MRIPRASHPSRRGTVRGPPLLSVAAALGTRPVVPRECGADGGMGSVCSVLVFDARRGLRVCSRGSVRAASLKTSACSGGGSFFSFFILTAPVQIKHFQEPSCSAERDAGAAPAPALCPFPSTGDEPSSDAGCAGTVPGGGTAKSAAECLQPPRAPPWRLHCPCLLRGMLAALQERGQLVATSKHVLCLGPASATGGSCSCHG